jgi:hypothetical protein
MRLIEFDKNRPRVLTAVNQYFDAKFPGRDKVANGQLVNALEQLGWNYYKGGNFSDVFVHPKRNYVIKINEIQDLGFAHFVKVVRRHPEQVHFPKISYKKTVEVKGKMHDIYLIEKLKPISAFSLEFSGMANYLERISIYYYKPLEEIFNESTVKMFKNYPSLVEAARIVGQEGGRTIIDIHDDNIMIRPKNNVIVITDPYADRGDM